MEQGINYIKKRLQEGATKEEIKKALIDGGWSPQHVEEAFSRAVPKKEPWSNIPAPQRAATTSGSLPSFTSELKKISPMKLGVYHAVLTNGLMMVFSGLWGFLAGIIIVSIGTKISSYFDHIFIMGVFAGFFIVFFAVLVSAKILRKRFEIADVKTTMYTATAVHVAVIVASKIIFPSKEIMVQSAVFNFVQGTIGSILIPIAGILLFYFLGIKFLSNRSITNNSEKLTS